MDFLYKIFAIPFGFLFQLVGNYGLSIIIFAVFFRLILLPSSVKQQKASAKMNRLQPKLRRIREKYQDYNPQERQQKIQMETSELYQREGYSSMGASCLPLLVQMPVLMGIYGVVMSPLTYVLNLDEATVTALTDAAKTVLSSENRYLESLVISNIDAIAKSNEALFGAGGTYAAAVEAIRGFNYTMFGIDLGSVPGECFNLIRTNGFNMTLLIVVAIPVLAGLSSLLSSVITQIRQKKNNPGGMENQQMMGCMMYMMPLMSVFLSWNLPAGMGMYWILSSLIAFVQTLILGGIYSPRKMVAKQMVEETVYRRSHEIAKKAAIKTENQQ